MGRKGHSWPRGTDGEKSAVGTDRPGRYPICPLVKERPGGLAKKYLQQVKQASLPVWRIGGSVLS